MPHCQTPVQLGVVGLAHSQCFSAQLPYCFALSGSVSLLRLPGKADAARSRTRLAQALGRRRPKTGLVKGLQSSRPGQWSGPGRRESGPIASAIFSMASRSSSSAAFFKGWATLRARDAKGSETLSEGSSPGLARWIRGEASNLLRKPGWPSTSATFKMHADSIALAFRWHFAISRSKTASSPRFTLHQRAHGFGVDPGSGNRVRIVTKEIQVMTGTGFTCAAY